MIDDTNNWKNLDLITSYSLEKFQKDLKISFPFNFNLDSGEEGTYSRVRLNIKITHKYTINSVEFKTTKTYNTNEIIIYNISPTVSYRKNKIGVNTSIPNNTNKVLTVVATSDAKIIDLHSARG